MESDTPRSSVPYAGARTGAAARDEIGRLLQRFGCSSVGFMDNYDERSLVLAFEWHGRRVQLRASAAGWAALYLKENPWNSRRRCNEAEWRRRALDQGLIAINSILRDWVKGQVVAIETGMVEFEHVFLPHMVTDNGETVVERLQANIQGMLPAPGAEAREP